MRVPAHGTEEGVRIVRNLANGSQIAVSIADDGKPKLAREDSNLQLPDPESEGTESQNRFQSQFTETTANACTNEPGTTKADPDGGNFAEALVMIAQLPLSDAEKVDAVRRLLGKAEDQSVQNKPPSPGDPTQAHLKSNFLSVHSSRPCCDRFGISRSDAPRLDCQPYRRLF